MALRLFPKINRFFTQNLGKVFYSKKSEATTTVQKLGDSDPSKSDETKKQHYSPHKPSLRTASERLDSEAKLMQKNMQLHQLQPALLPKYYKAPTEVQSGIFPKTPTQPGQFKRLEQSLTYKNVKLPLKKPRLANPFPDPVKVMQSDTVSDQEKADQMQASARIGFSQCRSYSTSGSCKKINDPEGKCKKFKADKCKPRARKSCEVEYVFQTSAVLLQAPTAVSSISNLEAKKKRRSTSGGNKPCPRPKFEKCKTEGSKPKKNKKPKGRNCSNSSRFWVTDPASVQHFPSLLNEKPSRKAKLITNENIFNMNDNQSIEPIKPEKSTNINKSGLPNPIPILDYVPPLFSDKPTFAPKDVNKIVAGDSSTPQVALESSVQFPSPTNGTGSVMLKKKKKKPKKDDKGKSKKKKPKKAKGKECCNSSESWATLVDSASARFFLNKSKKLNNANKGLWVTLESSNLIHFPTINGSSSMLLKKKKKQPKKDDKGKSKKKKPKKKSKGKECINSSKSWTTLVASVLNNKTTLLSEQHLNTPWVTLESSESVQFPSSPNGTSSMVLKKKKKKEPKKDDKGKKKKPKKKSKGKECINSSKSWVTLVEPSLLNNKTTLLNEQCSSTPWNTSELLQSHYTLSLFGNESIAASNGQTTKPKTLCLLDEIAKFMETEGKINIPRKYSSPRVGLKGSESVEFPSSSNGSGCMLLKKKKKKPKKDDKGKSKNKKPKKKSKGKEYVNSSKSWVTLADPISVCVFPSLLGNKTTLLNEQQSSMPWDTLERSKFVPFPSSTTGINSMLLKKKKKGKDKSKGKSKRGKSKCKKFPFTGCDNKKKKKRENSRRCPKPKKKKIKDCPPAPHSKCISVSDTPLLQLSNASIIENSCRFAYLCRQNKEDDDDGKCPNVDLSICKSKKKKSGSCEEDNKGTTKVCPTDLLEKKSHKPRRPQKKSMERNVPLASMLQPSPESPTGISPV